MYKRIVSKIPEENRRLVRVYILKAFDELQYRNLPEIILYLCLIFFNPNLDEWSQQNCHPSIQIKGFVVSIKDSWNCCVYESVFLKNIASVGIHIWKFRINLKHSAILIGIEAVTYDPETSICYGLCDNCAKTYCHRFVLWDVPVVETTTSIQSKDIIEMRLNLVQKMLFYYKNGFVVNKQRICFNKYRAVVTLSAGYENASAGVELMSYQNIYTCEIN